MVVAVGVAAIFGAMFHLTPLVAIGLYAAWQRSRRALAAALR
jgi:hydrogenase/urease accessory protein HupE